MSSYDWLEKAKWVRPDSYAGFDPEGDFVLLTKTRESLILEESNWDFMLAEITKVVDTLPEDQRDPVPSKAADFRCFGALPNEECRERWVYVWRASSSMVGWIDTMMVRADAPDVIEEKANYFLGNLDAYPILNEDDYSTRQEDALWEFWSTASDSERRYWHEKAGVEMTEDGDEPPEAVRDRLRDSGMFN